MAKLNKQSLCQKYYFCHETLCKVSEGFSISSGTSDYPVYALSTKYKQNSFLKANRKKLAKFTKLFVNN